MYQHIETISGAGKEALKEFKTQKIPAGLMRIQIMPLLIVLIQKKN